MSLYIKLQGSFYAHSSKIQLTTRYIDLNLFLNGIIELYFSFPILLKIMIKPHVRITRHNDSNSRSRAVYPTIMLFVNIHLNYILGNTESLNYVENL